MIRFTIREALLSVTTIAVLIAWGLDRTRLARSIDKWQWRSLVLKQYIEDEGTETTFKPDGISMHNAYGMEGVTHWFPYE